MTIQRPIERVLQIHTRYRQPGGEDRVVETERALLESAGVSVRQVVFDNVDLHDGASPLHDLGLGGRAVWNPGAARRVRADVRRYRPDAVHVHNTFAAASPSVYRAAGMLVAQTLHNYRFFCPAATAFRDGHVCTDCLGRAVAWPAVAHRCVRGSRPQSLVATTSLSLHRVAGTYRRSIGAYIALSEFQRDLFARGGLPADRIKVIPNFLEPDPGVSDVTRSGVVYVGRLSPEKGVTELLATARTVPGDITMVGDGPLGGEVDRAAAAGLVGAMGRLGAADVASEMRRAVALVVPSLWFEGLPLVVIEAFATATPVIASRIGALAEVVDDGVTGLLVRPGDPGDLARQIRWAIEHPAEMVRMGAAARRRYEASYRGPAHLAALLAVYQNLASRTRETARRRHRGRTASPTRRADG